MKKVCTLLHLIVCYINIVDNNPQAFSWESVRQLVPGLFIMAEFRT